MELASKNILHINLKTGQTGMRSYADLGEWLGGLGVGLKLWQDRLDNHPIIFTNGPFTAAFPSASHTCAIFWNPIRKQISDAYTGGRFATALRFSGLDGLVLENRAPQPSYLVLDEGRVDLLGFSAKDRAWGRIGLPDRKSTLVVLRNQTRVDDYFRFSGSPIAIGARAPLSGARAGLHQALEKKNLFAVVVSGSHHLEIKHPEKYQAAYQQILAAGAERWGSLLEGERACTGCPAGCSQASSSGYRDRNGTQAILPACLVACPLLDPIYQQVPLVFSGLHALGENLPHEMLEELPERVKGLRKELGGE